MSDRAVETVERVRFRELQPLAASDLAREQAYRIEQARRHEIGAHVWGISSGLELELAGRSARVLPGSAVDGYGRRLTVPEPVPIPDDAYPAGDDPDVRLDVWLVYCLLPETPAGRGRWDCGPGRHTRWREEARLLLTVGDGRRPPDPRRPPGVPDADLDFPPWRSPPDDPGRRWPVFLGRIQRTSSVFGADQDLRPLAGAVGEVVRAPGGTAELQVGAELTADATRFAVRTSEAGLPREPFALDRFGRAFLRAPTRLEGSMHVGGPAGMQRPAAALRLGRLPSVPAGAAPWRIYRVAVEEAGQTANELRVEIGHPGDKGDPRRYSLTIGHVDEQGRWRSCFRVRADCSVELSGQVEVHGLMIPPPIRPDPDDPRFGAALVARWLSGIYNASTALDALFPNGGDVT